MSRSVQITEAAATRPGGGGGGGMTGTIFFTSIMFDVTKKNIFIV